MVYGLPMVELHRILVNIALDTNGPLNRLAHSRALADPGDQPWP